MADTVLAGWTPFAPPTPEEKEIFAEATQRLKGVEYNTLAVSHQVVAGMNYRFFCNAKIIYPGASNESVMMHIYVNPDKTIAITAIHPIKE